MTRVSLKEAYDNKDVVAQIYAIRDTAESAEDSAEQAVTTANTASDHVDALVPQVEGAVQNANSASASAQASAQTVAGYENRLGAVETGLNNVTLRVTTAEGQIVTIQGRVTALETADGQNVKLTGEHAIGNYAVLLTGNQGPISGLKSFSNAITIDRNGIQPGLHLKRSDIHAGSETVNKGVTYIQWLDGDNTPLASVNVVLLPSGNARINVACRNTDGTMKEQVLLTGDVI